MQKNILSDINNVSHKSSLVSGKQAEQQALAFLEQQGLTLVVKNYRTYYGEIDLIMKDQAYYVFVEVRLRNNLNYASGIESVTLSKQKKIIKTTLRFLQENRLLNKVPCRFDVIGVEKHNQEFSFQWIKNAFLAK